ncbi:MAG: hypothetical protein FJW38_24045 [Acidobacteria bacterium]|nr:hypothetical protein [Acidobacteriota bacterium]
MLSDFDLLGVRSVSDLARRNPDALYLCLCDLTGVQQDPCVLDTLRCAVAQAKDPNLPAEQCNWWWWWSRQRLSKPPKRVTKSVAAAASVR